MTPAALRARLDAIDADPRRLAEILDDPATPLSLWHAVVHALEVSFEEECVEGLAQALADAERRRRLPPDVVAALDARVREVAEREAEEAEDEQRDQAQVEMEGR